MIDKRINWTPTAIATLKEFRSLRFTPQETLDYISQLILETDFLLSSGLISHYYIEQVGKYKGLHRIVVKGFRIYYEINEHEFTVLAILFPRQN